MADTSTDELFPRGIALGKAFCNRERERTQLATNLLARRPRHTWISGRRRHGKSSLIAQTLADVARKRGVRVESAGIDVFVVHNLKSLDEALREAIGTLSGKLLPRRRRALELKLAGESPSVARIDAMLRALDRAAHHYDVRGVLVIDEFQQISRLDEGHAVEGAIRSVAQSARALSFVFLGSERTLLAQMFEDRQRPLYMLCEHLEVTRIEAAAYRKFLNEAARLQWNRSLADAVLEAVLDRSQCHPFYVNALARLLWDQKKPPSVESVGAGWSQLMAEESERFKAQLLTVPHLTRAVLKALTLEPTSTPTAQAVLTGLGLSVGTVSGAVRWLEERDLLWRDQAGVLRPVDPMLAEYLSSI